MAVAGPKLNINAPTIELSPESVMKVANIPTVAIGLDGGMAPNEPEVKLDVSECTKYPTAALKQKWCKSNYESFGSDQCIDSFCSFCCSLVIPPHKRQSLEAKCNKICDHEEPEPAKEKWLQCTTPSKTNISIFRWCDSKVVDESRKKACKLDACKGCCLQNKFFLKYKAPQKDVLECIGFC